MKDLHAKRLGRGLDTLIKLILTVVACARLGVASATRCGALGAHRLSHMGHPPRQHEHCAPPQISTAQHRTRNCSSCSCLNAYAGVCASSDHSIRALCTSSPEALGVCEHPRRRAKRSVDDLPRHPASSPSDGTVPSPPESLGIHTQRVLINFRVVTRVSCAHPSRTLLAVTTRPSRSASRDVLWP